MGVTWELVGSYPGVFLPLPDGEGDIGGGVDKK